MVELTLDSSSARVQVHYPGYVTPDSEPFAQGVCLTQSAKRKEDKLRTKSYIRNRKFGTGGRILNNATSTELTNSLGARCGF
jgi:hypothetical protein